MINTWEQGAGSEEQEGVQWERGRTWMSRITRAFDFNVSLFGNGLRS